LNTTCCRDFIHITGINDENILDKYSIWREIHSILCRIEILRISTNLFEVSEFVVSGCVWRHGGVDRVILDVDIQDGRRMISLFGKEPHGTYFVAPDPVWRSCKLNMASRLGI
jgi:hypothetical protein